MRLDLNELTSRTGIEPRRLRYVLDHKLVPRMRVESIKGKAGRPRTFTLVDAVCIVCAAHLLDLGLAHNTIRFFLGSLLQINELANYSRYPLPFSLLGGDLVAVELGDGKRIRFCGSHFSADSVRPRKRGNAADASDQNFRPTVIIRINMQRVWEQIHREVKA